MNCEKCRLVYKPHFSPLHTESSYMTWSHLHDRTRVSFDILSVDSHPADKSIKSETFERRGVPAALKRSTADVYSAVPVEYADMVLIDCIDAPIVLKNIMYSYYGTVVKAHLIRSGGKTYVYYLVNQFLSPNSKDILAVLSRHFMNDYRFYYNEPCSLDNIQLAMPHVAGKATSHHTVASIVSLPAPKISGQHHLHFLAHEVWQSLDPEQQKKAASAFFLPRDITTTMMAGVLLWLASLSDLLYEVVVQTPLLRVPDVATFIKVGKALSVQAKSLQNLVREDLRPLFEADVLVNRAYGQVDWLQEKLNRTEPRLARIDENVIYREACKLFSQRDPVKEKPRHFKWSDFWEARWQWSAAGSFHSQYPDDLKYLSKEQELRNKFIALITMPDISIDTLLQRTPQVHAWSSVKYEWGKMRAIYGTDITSYILTHFAFFNCEDTLPRHFPIGKLARPSFVSARVRAVLDNATPLCVDYEDFNSQHSTVAMQAVMQAYLDANFQSFSPDQRSAALWAIQSLGDTIVHDNAGTRTTYSSKGTLMSGHRLTTFLNSVLNYIYTTQLLDPETTLFRSVHNGDDVLIGTNNFATATMLVRNSHNLGIRLQRSKSNFGGIAEFLRVDHIRGTHGQYLTRNIATLAHSRIESKVAVGLPDVLEAMEERFTEFVTRGGPLHTVAALRSLYYPRMAQVYRSDVSVAYAIKNSHRVVGGIDPSPTASILQTVITQTVAMTTELSPSLPGVLSYAKKLKSVLDLDVSVALVRDRVFFSDT